MIARELDEFFAGFAPERRARSCRGPATRVFLSNVNACYRRACWEEIRFPDVAYAEDQAFGARACSPPAGARSTTRARRCCTRTTTARSSSCAATSTSTAACARRSATWSRCRRAAWPASRGARWRPTGAGCASSVAAPGARARWTARSALHHSARKLFAALGSRAERLPARVQRAISLERRDGAGSERRRPASVVPPGRPEPTSSHEVARLARDGPAPLDAPVPGMSARERLHVAVVIPPFGRGSGGHSTIFTLVHGSSGWATPARSGCTTRWASTRCEAAAVLRQRIVDRVRAAARAGVQGLRRVARRRRGGGHRLGDRLPGAAARPAAARAPTSCTTTSPSSSPTSARAALGRRRPTSSGPLPDLGSRWLRDLLRERYGHDGCWFRFGVDHATYRPLAARAPARHGDVLRRAT